MPASRKTKKPTPPTGGAPARSGEPAAPTPEELLTFVAETEAANHLSLYARERHGLLVWRAYRAFRTRGLPVPEVILKKFDEWAIALHASKPAPGGSSRPLNTKEMAQALELAGGEDEKQGAVRLQQTQRKRVIAQAVFIYVHLAEQRKERPAMEKIYARVAEELRGTHGTTSAGMVKKVYTEWMRGKRSQRASRKAASLSGADIAGVMKGFGRKM